MNATSKSLNLSAAHGPIEPIWQSLLYSAKPYFTFQANNFINFFFS